MEFLHGTWRIRAGRVDKIVEHGFTITGSTLVDGRHFPSEPDFELLVEGQRWSVSLEERKIRSDDWIQQQIHRSTAFDSKGLVVRLESHRPPPSGPGPHTLIYYFGIEIICVCEDASITVAPPEGSYDFTYPKRSDWNGRSRRRPVRHR